MGTSEPVTVVVVGAGPAAPPGVHVLAHTDEPRHAPRLVAAARPQVVLVGLGRDRDAVLAVVSELTVRVPDARVLAVSGKGDPAADVLAAVRAGASGYLVTADDPEALADAVRRTAEGEAVFSPGLAEVVLEEYGRPPDPTRSRLTEREADVLRLVVEGLTARQIATRLVLSPRTVEHHIQRVLRRLGVPNRAALVRRAVENGLV
jgi:DNA-binding NarL/FixJ family response regulator